MVASRVSGLFDDLAREAEAFGVVVSPCFEIRPENAADAILAVAWERDVNLIVLGSARKRRLRLLLGATAEQVMREASQPVWLVRPGRSHREVKRIACAVNGSQAGSEALREAIALARTFVAQLTLLGVVSNAEPEQRLEQAAGLYDLHGIEVQTLILEGEVRKTIVEAVTSVGADLLVMGEAGRTGMARFFRGNTAEHVVRRVPCSLLAVKRRAELVAAEASPRWGRRMNWRSGRISSLIPRQSW
jgi:nucleotide-binding universal stress UspA family protein